MTDHLRKALTTDLSLSRLAYGMWRLADDADTSPSHINAKIDACLGQGITTLDQADIYGGYAAEALLGACFRANPSLRDQVELVTKCGIIAPMGRHSDAAIKHYDTSPAHITASVDQSLQLMATDHIDLLLIHRPDPFMDHHETGRALDDLITSGKVRAVGASNFRPWDMDLLQAAMTHKLASNQIELSLLAHDAFANGDLAHLQQHGIAPMAWSPLAGGRLVDGSHPQLMALLSSLAQTYGTDAGAVATAWLLAHPAGIIPILGSNRLDRIARFGDALSIDMDRQTWFALYSKALGRKVA